MTRALSKATAADIGSLLGDYDSLDDEDPALPEKSVQKSKDKAEEGLIGDDELKDDVAIDEGHIELIRDAVVGGVRSSYSRAKLMFVGEGR